MMLALGPFLFGIDTIAYQELSRRTEWRHARNERVGAIPASQYVGPGEDRVTLPGVAYAELQDGAAALDQLRDMADAGEAYALVAGDGRVLGSFTIDGIDERSTDFFSDGRARKIDFTIDLSLAGPANAAPASSRGPF